MNKNRSGKISLTFLILIVVILAAAAGAAGYLLYLRPAPDEAQPEVAARIRRGPDAERLQPRLKKKITEEERQAASLKAFFSEFASPLDRPTTMKTFLDEIAPADKPVQVSRAARVKAGQTQTTASPETPPAAPEPGPPKPEAAPTGVETRPKINAAPEPLKGRRPPKARVWVINALSTQDPDRARRLLDALMSQPYRVYAYQTEIKNQTWIRIRVGFFDTREEAQEVGKGLARKHKLPPPWLLRPGPQELAKYYGRR